MDATETKLTAIMEPWVDKTGGLITALRSAQEKFGYLPAQAEAIAAEAFNLTRAEVKGVISFYADFHREPKGRTVVRLCAAEACQAAGGRALQTAVEKRFALKVGETSASRDLTLEPVYCLGLCSCAPAAMVGERLVGRADAGRIEAAVERESEAAE
ncbi:MAG: NAD(P)H-dependent oxidoreductase subunit E [Pseudomonadota bacterium]